MKQVLFWSKYSANSKKLINLMDQHNAKIESVCIDNESVRQRIAKDKKIGISVVPTILALYQNGVIEKYEGEKAFELLYAAFPQKPPSSVSRATIKMQDLPSPSCEGMENVEEPVPAPSAQPQTVPIAVAVISTITLVGCLAILARNRLTSS